MILALAIGVGAAIGLISAWLKKQPYQLPDLALVWLGILAFLPQWLVIYQPAISEQIPDQWASIALITSQILLLVFVLANRRRSGFWILGLGVILNLAVILLNKGWMPITPEMVNRLYPLSPVGSWEIGERLGNGKDIVLNLQDMRLWFLGDQILIPFPPPLHPTAFSIGDFLIAIGAVRFLSHQPSLKLKHSTELRLQTIQPTK